MSESNDGGAMPLNANDKTCQVPRAELVQRALDHYDEISNQACHWMGIIPGAIRTWGELEEGETVAGLRVEVALLRAALEAILQEPYGCPFCNSGKLRNPLKGHTDDCGYALAQAALAPKEDK